MKIQFLRLSTKKKGQVKVEIKPQNAIETNILSPRNKALNPVGYSANIDSRCVPILMKSNSHLEPKTK